MSEDTTKLLDKIDNIRKKLLQGTEKKNVAGLVSALQNFFDNMDPDDKKTVRNRFNSSMSRFTQRSDKLSGGKSSERIKAAANAKGGVIRRRGGGIAKRGMGIAK
jgi:hypothetical protein